MSAVPLRLTRRVADNIVAVVRRDRTCQERIGNSIFSKVPAGLGWGGSLRNWKMIFSGKDPSEFENYAVVCTGIADATSAAVRGAKLAGVSNAMSITREKPLLGLEFLGTTAHDATRIDLSRFGAVVFDWHATLLIDNPIIFRTIDDFRNDRFGVLYKEFRGF